MTAPLTTYTHPEWLRGPVTVDAVFVPIVAGRVNLRGAVPLVLAGQVRS